jgi:hypothetical protein
MNASSAGHSQRNIDQMALFFDLTYAGIYGWREIL